MEDFTLSGLAKGYELLYFCSISIIYLWVYPKHISHIYMDIFSLVFPSIWIFSLLFPLYMNIFSFVPTLYEYFFFCSHSIWIFSLLFSLYMNIFSFVPSLYEHFLFCSHSIWIFSLWSTSKARMSTGFLIKFSSQINYIHR